MAAKFKKGVDLQGQRGQNAADASAATDLVTLQQMQAFVRGLNWKATARVKATGNVTLTAPGASINGVTMVTGDRFLAGSQTTGTENGVYVWNGAAVPATRALDMDSSAEFIGAAIYVTEGTSGADTMWTQTLDPFTLGSSTAVFTQFGGGGTTYTADGNGIELTGSSFGLELDGTSLSKSATGLRIASAAAGAGLVESSGILAVGAGTGITVAADTVSVDTSVVVRKYAADCAATTNPQTFTHGLGTADVQVFVWESTELVFADVTKTGSTSVTVDFGSAPTAAQYRVVVQG